MPAMIRLATASGDVLINPDAIAAVGSSDIPPHLSARFAVPSRYISFLGSDMGYYILDTEENIGKLMSVISMVL